MISPSLFGHLALSWPVSPAFFLFIRYSVRCEGPLGLRRAGGGSLTPATWGCRPLGPSRAKGLRALELPQESQIPFLEENKGDCPICMDVYVQG